jgi:hypothetical protein
MTSNSDKSKFVTLDRYDEAVLAFGEEVCQSKRFIQSIQDVFRDIVTKIGLSKVFFTRLRETYKIPILPSSSDQNLPLDENVLFTQGIPCRILNPGSSHWRQARIRVVVSIEIAYDPALKDSEESLDDLRRTF